MLRYFHILSNGIIYTIFKFPLLVFFLFNNTSSITRQTQKLLFVLTNKHALLPLIQKFLFLRITISRWDILHMTFLKKIITCQNKRFYLCILNTYPPIIRIFLCSEIEYLNLPTSQHSNCPNNLSMRSHKCGISGALKLNSTNFLQFIKIKHVGSDIDSAIWWENSTIC